MVTLSDGVVRFLVEFLGHALTEFVKFVTSETAGEFVAFGFHQIVEIHTLFTLQFGCVGNLTGVEGVFLCSKLAEDTPLGVSLFDGLDDEIVLFFVDGFLFVGVACGIDQCLKLCSEFFFLVFKLVNNLVHLLEQAFIRRSSDGAEETPEASLLLRHGGSLGSLFFKDCPSRVF